MTTPDVLAMLEQRIVEMRDEADATRRKLAKGLAVNGDTGLRRISDQAKDALADLHAEREGVRA